MPNGRTIYKVLMQNRQSVEWGRRAFVTVRLPSSVVPVPCPPFFKDWGKEIFSGTWVKEFEDGSREVRAISKLYSKGDPRRYAEGEEASIHCLKVSGTVSPEYTWWEGILRVGTPQEDGEMSWKRSFLRAEDIEAHAAVSDWRDGYLSGLIEADRGPVLQAFMNATERAKTHYTAMSRDGKYIYFTYSVKWFYRKSTHRFCADLKRAFRVARQNNIEAKLIR